MEFVTIKEAKEFFRLEVYQVREEDEDNKDLFEKKFAEWVEVNDITIAEIDYPEEGDFTGVDNEDR
jgi:hypothetical protein